MFRRGVSMLKAQIDIKKHFKTLKNITNDTELGGCRLSTEGWGGLNPSPPSVQISLLCRLLFNSSKYFLIYLQSCPNYNYDYCQFHSSHRGSTTIGAGVGGGSCTPTFLNCSVLLYWHPHVHPHFQIHGAALVFAYAFLGHPVLDSFYWGIKCSRTFHTSIQLY